jgi:multidrug transporter EmrE-like cation transporter
MASQFCEVGKIILQNKVLSQSVGTNIRETDSQGTYAKQNTESRCQSGNGLNHQDLADEESPQEVCTGSPPESSRPAVKMDPLSFVMLVSPCCLPFLLTKLYIFQWEPESILSHFRSNYMLLGLNCLVAFSLNVSIAFFMQMGTALSFIVCGVAKDVLIVFAGVLFFGDHVSPLQIFGFSVQIIGIILYSLVRSFPDNFPDDRSLIHIILSDHLGFVSSKRSESMDSDTDPLLSRSEAEDLDAIHENMGGSMKFPAKIRTTYCPSSGVGSGDSDSLGGHNCSGMNSDVPSESDT